jgi:hypothetical protein
VGVGRGVGVVVVAKAVAGVAGNQRKESLKQLLLGKSKRLERRFRVIHKLFGHKLGFCA